MIVWLHEITEINNSNSNKNLLFEEHPEVIKARKHKASLWEPLKA